MRTAQFWLNQLNLRRSFRRRLGAAIATTILIFSVLLACIVGDISQRQIQADRGELMAQMAYQLAGALDRDMFIYYQEIQTLASLEEMRSPQRPTAQKQMLLDRMQEAFSDFAWIGLTDSRGIVMASTHGLLTGANVSKRPWFIEGRTRPNVQDVHSAKLLTALVPNPSSDPLRLVDVTAPVVDNTGTLVGVLGGHLYWQWATALRDNLLQPLKDYKQVEIQILSSTGDVLLGPGRSSDDISAPVNLSGLKSFQAAQQGETEAMIEPWLDNAPTLTGYAQTQGYRSYPGLGWVVLVHQPTQEAFAAARSLKHSICLWGLALGVLGGALSWYIAGQMVKPVMAIAHTAEGLRTGTTRAPMPVFSGQDEIAQLSRSVGQLFANLDQQTTLLQQFNADLEAQIAARTASLNQTNHRLQQEIEVRSQTEQALQNANQELQRLTLVDGLTGIANRRHFDQYLEQEWRRSVRDRLPLSLILLDVDYFKLYNDHYGHQSGDACLCQIAQAIAIPPRRATDLPVRYGGEEFAVILPNTDRAGAIYLAETLRQAVKALHLPHAKSAVGPWVTISLGVATCLPSATLNPINLIRTADGLLYQAKQQGRDRLVANP
ncbi:diguanylate cyclase [Nodosilinea sp. FACHB-13]|uniref:diguanylate cyclase n=1 Tax=Cyanophyceae TaxID=3028117 RepID=UPI0016878692|nr:diguanylate cyclase [Nodosilinea sp. FACHB-13]MBD2105722.1 diguanylate cyclase [Nodosilinea sp. FACHB-13]